MLHQEFSRVLQKWLEVIFANSLLLFCLYTFLSGGVQKVSESFSETFWLLLETCDIVFEYFRNIVTIDFRSTSLLLAISFLSCIVAMTLPAMENQLAFFVTSLEVFAGVQAFSSPDTFIGSCHNVTRNPNSLLYNNMQPEKFYSFQRTKKSTRNWHFQSRK